MSVEVGQGQKAAGPAMLTVEQVADRLGLSRDAVDTMIAKGELPSVRLSERRTRIPVDLLEACIAARTVVPPDDVPDAAARAAHTAALLRRRARMRWEGYPDPSPRIELPAGQSVDQNGVLRG